MVIPGHSYIQNSEDREEAGTPDIVGCIRTGPSPLGKNHRPLRWLDDLGMEGILGKEGIFETQNMIPWNPGLLIVILVKWLMKQPTRVNCRFENWFFSESSKRMCGFFCVFSSLMLLAERLEKWLVWLWKHWETERCWDWRQFWIIHIYIYVSSNFIMMIIMMYYPPWN